MARLAAVLCCLILALVPAQALARPSVVVVEIGGVGTDATPGAPWNVLEPYLDASVEFRQFSYDTCGDIGANVQKLTAFVESLRPARVILAGHSMGGVLALGAVGKTDLSGVIVVDAPVNGLDGDLVSFGQSLGIVPFPCLALDQMEDAAWSTTSRAATEQALAQGVGVLDISNGYDTLVPLVAQELPQDVNLRFNVRYGSGFVNHTAVFHSTAAMAAIAQFIRAR